MIRCFIQSNPDIQFVTWYKDRRPFDANAMNDIVMLNNGSLYFQNVTHEHQVGGRSEQLRCLQCETGLIYWTFDQTSFLNAFAAGGHRSPEDRATLWGKDFGQRGFCSSLLEADYSCSFAICLLRVLSTEAFR